MDKLSELVKKAQQGEKASYGEIYNLFIKKIYRFIYYSVNEKQLAEDLTQNTFLKAWISLGNFSFGKGTFQAYLFTIARNLVIDYQRRKKELSIDENWDISSADNLEDQIEKEEEKEKVKMILDNLEDDERRLIILRYFEELEFEEIAQVLNKNSGTLRVRVHRILKKLKDKLEEK